MKYLVIAALCIGAAQAFTAVIHADEGLPKIEGRISRGKLAEPNQFPWHVAIYVTYPEGGFNWFGGSLLSNRWVLTAAHCMAGVSNFHIRLGNVNLLYPEVKADSNVSIVHPNFNPRTLANNIGLIRLPNPVDFISSIQPIRLPSISQIDSAFTGEVVSVSGHGQTSDNSFKSLVLLWTNMTVIENKDCAELFGSIAVTPEVVCASGTPSPVYNTCDGDDGGALVFFQGSSRIPLQIGIVSFMSGRGCQAGDPSGFVRVSKYIHWISSQTGIPLFP